MVLIAPSILAIQPQTIDNVLDKIAQITHADMWHVDVMDGRFVPNTTIWNDIENVRKLRERTDIPLDVHLMVEKPEDYIDPLLETGVDRITFHIEAATSADQMIEKILDAEKKVGIAQNPGPGLTKLSPYFGAVDVVLVMSVFPGRCGQQYLERTGKKIEVIGDSLRARNSDAVIEVDGGIKLSNLYKPRLAGAHIAVSGSGIFSQEDPNSIIRQMKDTIVIGSDHGGYVLKSELIGYLRREGYRIDDIGTFDTDSCDYPDIAHRVGNAISDGRYDKGILVCGTGIGMSIAANKHKGVRAALIHNVYAAEMTRKHNNANIACFGERSMDRETVYEAARIFLETGLSEEKRHKRRIEKIE